ncbi:MAG: hypothetical protein N2V73_00875 [Candidatus Methanospirare jalkutatii]|nr:hypothetical protein [Candidatus Methanospirare jalkutatii]MCW7079648.1 hypothetical protein [Candidatus Methanospirare jalkutatii]
MRRTREGELYYSPSCKFEYLKKLIDNKEGPELLKCFEERVKELYLEPAYVLIKEANDKKSDNSSMGLVFSAGLICVSAIDFLGRFYFGCPKDEVECRFVGWLLKYMSPPFNALLAKKFYKDFRNGLVHECRIKNGGEFSLNEGETIREEVDDNGVRYLVVNPEKLWEKLDDGFKKYLDDLQQDENMLSQLIECLKKDFNEDFRKEDYSNER